MKQIDKYTYLVDEDKVVWIWETAAKEAGEPAFLRQPSYPDNTEFTDVDDATAWAEDYLNKIIEAASNPPSVEG